MTSLDPMPAKSEMDLICSLILNIGEAFKWEMDPQPNLDRNFRNTPAWAGTQSASGWAAAMPTD
jgi:hypothetical protein